MRGLMLSAGAALLLAGCASTAEIGIEPVMSPVVPYTGASMYPGYYDLKAASAPPNIRRNSLWDDRQSRLFTDPRALTVGDILTVAILINDRAQLRNQSERRRTADRSLGASASVNLEGFEFAGDGEGTIGSGTQSAGRGETQRSEDIRLRVAAVVMDVLPNGNLVIRGSQEVRVNAELRILNIEGIVRPADIGASNTIDYDRIAEARISYGGRGRLTEVQQPPYGQQFLDAVLPF
jgi:flagellar L-ring protein precursor FlgH